jgi:hypothetical protein
MVLTLLDMTDDDVSKSLHVEWRRMPFKRLNNDVHLSLLVRC